MSLADITLGQAALIIGAIAVLATQIDKIGALFNRGPLARQSLKHRLEVVEKAIIDIRADTKDLRSWKIDHSEKDRACHQEILLAVNGLGERLASMEGQMKMLVAGRAADAPLWRGAPAKEG